MRKIRCLTPKCEGALLVRNALESTVATDKYSCPQCSRVYFVQNMGGLAIQAAPPIIAATALISLGRILFGDLGIGDHDFGHGSSDICC